MLKTRFLATFAFSLLAVTACGSDDATPSDSMTPADAPMTTAAPGDSGASADSETADDSGASASVGLKDSRYDPTDIEVSVGETVTFTNNDPYDHTITSAEDSTVEFDSGEISQDVTFEQSFDTAGSYNFFCQIHPTMRGTITVS